MRSAANLAGLSCGVHRSLEALAALAGCDHIVHGGDIGGQSILDQLAAIAPLTVVRGNNDRQAWAAAVPGSIAARRRATGRRLAGFKISPR